MTPISHTTTIPWSSPWAPTCFQKTQDIYFQIIKKFVESFRSCGCKMLSILTATQLIEPINTFYTSYYLLKGLFFRTEGLDPTEISEEQAQHTATLLIHGNYHNPTAWTPFVQDLKEDIQGPLYSVHLNSGDLKENDREIIDRKIEEIQRQYQAHGRVVTIDIIGHSRGSEYAFLTALSRESVTIVNGNAVVDWAHCVAREGIGKIFRIGTPTSPIEEANMPPYLFSRIYEIDAMWDLIIPERSTSPRKWTVPTGHVGLLYNQEVYQKILEWKAEASA